MIQYFERRWARTQRTYIQQTHYDSGQKRCSHHECNLWITNFFGNFSSNRRIKRWTYITILLPKYCFHFEFIEFAFIDLYIFIGTVIFSHMMYACIRAYVHTKRYGKIENICINYIMNWCAAIANIDMHLIWYFNVHKCIMFRNRY